MIRDRGSIKWVSMMLPEHVKLLREYDESLKKSEKPVLDEQKYEQLNGTILSAMEENHPLQFIYYQNGELKTLIGNIHYVDGLKGELRIIDCSAKKQVLKMEDIIEVEHS